jgi:hypothetical protein
VRTEKIEERLLPQMHPVLEHSRFFVRIRLLEQNLGLVIVYQPRAAVRGPAFNDHIILELIDVGLNITNHL